MLKETLLPGNKVLGILGFAAVIVSSISIPVYGSTILTLLAALVGSSVLALTLLKEPYVGILLLSATIPLEGVQTFSEGVTLTRVLGIAVFVLWLLRKVALHESIDSVVKNPFFIFCALLLTYSLTSVMWARYPVDSLISLVRLFRLFLWSLLIIDILKSEAYINGVLKVLVSAGSIAIILTILQYATGNVSISGRAGGNISGASLNNTAAVIVTILPFAFYLFNAKLGSFWRLLGIFYVILSLIAVTVTFSRTSLLLSIFVLMAEYWESIKERRKLVGMIFIALISISLIMLLVPMGAIVERMQTIVPTIRSVFIVDEYSKSNIIARGFIYRVGIEIFRNNPIFGVGFDNFSHYFITFQSLVPGADRIVGDLRGSHSAYLSFLVDLGLLGLIIWVTMLGVLLYALVKTYSSNTHTKDMRGKLIKAIGTAFLVQIFYGFVAIAQYEKLLWTLFGLSVAAVISVGKKKNLSWNG